jgi:ornithine cyclodeaminase/alanine dehydrogenase-like protein (mu-crystallin family)
MFIFLGEIQVNYMTTLSDKAADFGAELASAGEFLYLNGLDVQRIVDEIDPLALIKEVFRLHATGKTILPDEAYLGWKNTNDEAVRSLNMPAYVGGEFHVSGTKIINSNPANKLRGLPRASGLTLLFDPETTRVRCLMEGSRISALRTAAVSVMCIQELKKKELRSVAVIGSGVIGEAHAMLAMKRVPGLERLLLFDTNATAARALAAKLTASVDGGIVVESSESARDAVRNSDAIIAATNVTEGYIPYDWLAPGTVVINVSLDDLLPEVMMKADLLFVDDWPLVRSGSRRLLGKMWREGVIAGPREVAGSGVRRVDGEIGDIVSGSHAGRLTEAEIVVVNPFGLAIEDIAFAAKVYTMAKERGIGTLLPV